MASRALHELEVRSKIDHPGLDATFLADWELWVRQAEALYRRWLERLPDDDPFAYNETASGSVLACAATMAGGLGIADYHTEKRKVRGADPTDRWHRGDLWIRHPGGGTWAVELKQVCPAHQSVLRAGQIEIALRNARADAWNCRRKEADHRLGCVVVSTWWQGARPDPDAHQVITGMMDKAPCAARFGVGRSQILILLAPAAARPTPP